MTSQDYVEYYQEHLEGQNQVSPGTVLVVLIPVHNPRAPSEAKWESQFVGAGDPTSFGPLTRTD